MTEMRSITAAVVRDQGAPFAIEEARIAAPQGGEVLVRIVAVGVCHTDIIVRDQYYPVPLPAVLGHEGAGVVEAVGPGVTAVEPGDHVVLSFASCGGCGPCLTGHPAHCGDFFALNFGGGRKDGSTAKDDLRSFQRFSGTLRDGDRSMPLRFKARIGEDGEVELDIHAFRITKANWFVRERFQDRNDVAEFVLNGVNAAQAIKARNAIVHSGHHPKTEDGPDLWDHMTIVRELVVRFLLTAIGYRGQYITHVGGYRLTHFPPVDGELEAPSGAPIAPGEDP